MQISTLSVQFVPGLWSLAIDFAWQSMSLRNCYAISGINAAYHPIVLSPYPLCHPRLVLTEHSSLCASYAISSSNCRSGSSYIHLHHLWY
eukprot:1791458-Rhodomonas_salina.1